MEKIKITTEISIHSKEFKDGKATIIPTIFVGTATDKEDDSVEYTLCTNWTSSALVVEKKGTKKQCLISFTQFIEALEEAGIFNES